MFPSLELQDRGKATSLNLLAILSLRQPGAHFALLAARAHSWLTSTRILPVLIPLDQQPLVHTAVLLYKLLGRSVLTHSPIKKKKKKRKKKKHNKEGKKKK